MLRLIKDANAQAICGGGVANCSNGICPPPNMGENQPTSQGKSPTGAEPAQKSDSTSSTGSSSTGGVVTHS